MALLYEKKEGYATITFNRPKVLNAMDGETLTEFSEAIVDFDNDPTLNTAIITGAGTKSFSAGADLVNMVPDLQAGRFTVPPTIMRGLTTWKPLIAAVNGIAIGGGLEIMLACDLVIAAENATFGCPEVKWGMLPGWGGTQRIKMKAPWAKACEMLLLGAIIDAQEALSLNLVNKVVPAQDLMSTAIEWAERMSKYGPLALRAAKEAMYRGHNVGLDEGLRIEDLLNKRLWTTEDGKEGPLAFTEKRTPQFRGR